MRERHPKILLSALVAAVALAGLLVAGCGSSDSSSSTTAATAATTTAASTGGGGAATIDVADNPDLGKILTDADGNTVYLFEKDENGMSNCSGGCAAEWPPVTTSGTPKAGSRRRRLADRDDQARRRQRAGHLRRPPALHLLGRLEARATPTATASSCTAPSGTR